MNFDQDAADFISVEAGALNVDESNFGFTMLDEGVITTSFTEMGKAISVENDEVLFSINLSARANTTVNDVISLTNQYTLAEAYNAESEVSDVQLVFNTAGLVSTIGGEFELFQNNPNPFSEKTNIGFILPEAQFATLKVYDVTGKLIFEYSNNFDRGFNEISLKAQILKTEGTMYYQLSSEKYTATRKMILLH